MLTRAVARPKTVCCLIIGDEVLSGKTRDSNSHFLAGLCFRSGLHLSKILVVPDIKEEIQVVRDLVKQYDHVITSGGIGPTHDDITYESIAGAFGLPLKYHQETLERMRKASVLRKMNLDMNKDRMRMALFPEGPGVKVLYPIDDPTFWVPVVTVKDQGTVAIFPGIPRLFERMAEAYVQTIADGKFHRALIGTSKPEGEIAQILRDLQSKTELKIGSYPHFPPQQVDGKQELVVVSVVGSSESEVQKLAKDIEQHINGWIKSSL
ncbi:MoaB/Mog domain-containing protein [Gorgonomyces haynaldii]|nr:MoaB/Mog domain-containing protein [Gorgonomyces haynaldii]